MKILDLFSGLGGWSAAFKERGHQVDTVDINPEFKPTICMDIMDMTKEQVQGYDLILASPPCECFSVASIGHHWGGGKRKYEPKTEEAKRAIALVQHLFQLVEGRPYIIENPRGVMRKIAPIKPTTTIWYCKYGDKRAKPTDIWTNRQFSFQPPCHNGAKNHEAAPRGAKTGTQGIKGSAERARIPYKLSLDICLQTEKRVFKRTGILSFGEGI